MKTKIKNISKIIFALLVAGLFFGLTSCSGNIPIAQRSGAQLWGENCAHCHNMRSPETLNDEKWEVAATHMRTRANLTASETEKIISFLKSSN